MKKKIVFFQPYFQYGGVAKTNIRFSRYFIKNGYEVDYLTFGHTFHLYDELKETGVNFVQLKVQRTLFAIPKLIKYLRKESKRYTLTLISCQNFANVIAIMTSFLVSKKIKYILCERNHLAEFERGKSGIKSKLLLFLMKQSYKYADLVVANAKRTALDLSSKMGVRVECVYNPTLDGTIEEKSKEIVNHKWFTNKQHPIILGVGRFSKQKDFSTLIQAFAIVRKKRASRLVIVGKKENMSAYEHLIKTLELTEDIWIPGFDVNPYKYMAKADVFVLSSLYEGLPNVLIEAIRVGTPVISTNCLSGPEEILLSGKGGDLVDIGDYTEMAKAIERYLDNPEYAKTKWQIAYNNISRFTPDQAGKHFMELIEQ